MFTDAWNIENSATRVLKVLELAGQTHQELAVHLGISVATVSRWVNSHNLPDPRSRRALKSIYGGLTSSAGGKNA